jgi:hypothetical protein
MSPERPTDLWDQLEQTLAEQAKSLRQAKWGDFESALEQSRGLVAQLCQDRQALQSVSASRQERLRRSYEQLMLLAEVHRHTLDQQIQRLRGSRRAIRAYQQHR